MSLPKFSGPRMLTPSSRSHIVIRVMEKGLQIFDSAFAQRSIRKENKVYNKRDALLYLLSHVNKRIIEKIEVAGNKLLLPFLAIELNNFHRSFIHIISTRLQQHLIRRRQ